MPFFDILNILVRIVVGRKSVTLFMHFTQFTPNPGISEGPNGFIRTNWRKVLYQERCHLWLTRNILVGTGEVNGQFKVCKERWWFAEN